MTDEQMKKLLEEDTGEVPERLHQAMLAAFGQIEDEPFDGTELPLSVEAAEKPRRPRHVPRQGGRFRRMMLVMLITLGLLGGLAVATTANPRLLEVFWGKDFEPSAQVSAYIAHDLAEVETNGYRVRVEEAVYDGMTLYVRYSIRDMSCDHLLGETNVDTGRRMLNEQEITAFDHAPVGWWTDNLWINGKNVDMPGLSGGETWAGDENGEIVVSEMYRLDQVGVFLSGDVQIDLPIGEKQHYDYETWQSMLKGRRHVPQAGRGPCFVHAELRRACDALCGRRAGDFARRHGGVGGIGGRHAGEAVCDGAVRDFGRAAGSVLRRKRRRVCIPGRHGDAL